MAIDAGRLREEISKVYSEVARRAITTAKGGPKRGKPFTGAGGQRKAEKFGTEGVNICARKP